MYCLSILYTKKSISKVKKKFGQVRVRFLVEPCDKLDRIPRNVFFQVMRSGANFGHYLLRETPKSAPTKSEPLDQYVIFYFVANNSFSGWGVWSYWRWFNFNFNLQLIYSNCNNNSPQRLICHNPLAGYDTRRGPGTPGGLPGGADSPEHATLKGARSAGGWPRRLGWPLGRGVRPRSRCPGASWRCGCGGPRSAVTRLGRRGVAVAVQVGRDDGEGVIRECAAQIMCSASDFGPVLLVSRDRAVFRRPRGHV